MDFKIGWPSDDDVEAVRKTMVDVEERINAQLPPMVSKVTLQSFRWGSKAPVIGLTEIENLDADGFKARRSLYGLVVSHCPPECAGHHQALLRRRLWPLALDARANQSCGVRGHCGRCLLARAHAGGAQARVDAAARVRLASGL